MAVSPLASTQWREATRRDPCPICGRTDWCRTNGAWAICRRVDSGTGIHKVDKSGADYWAYRLDGAGPASMSALPEIPPEPERAGDETLYRVYTALLKALTLSEAHRENLRKRGLSDEEIDRRRYRTMPLTGRAAIAKQIAASFGSDLLLRVPGFYIDEDPAKRQRWLTLAGAPGILIPVRDLSGQIVAIKIRADNPGDGPRYTWLSSAKYGGPGPSNRVHVPFHDASMDRSLVRVTEGELKADIATVLSGVLTLSAPGVSSWRTLLPALQAVGAKTVRLAFDADAATNQNVARALGLAAEALTQEGYAVELERWDPAAGKGIDDVLAADKEIEVVQAGEESFAAVADILDSAGVDLLPKICATTQNLKQATGQAVEALQRANDRDPYLFLRGGPTRIEPDDDGEMIVRELTPDRVRHELARVARWIKYGRNNEELDAKPPLDVVRDVLASPRLPFPALSSIVRAPTFAPDGTLQLTPGYCAASKTYYVPTGSVPDVPNNPTPEDLDRARSLILDELFGDFPFAGDADRAHAVALFLLPFVRPMINGPTPLHLVEASTQGSGKGLLADVALRPALGRAIGIIPPPKDDEEFRKSITARLCEGRAAVVLDNIYWLTSGVLAAALTAEVWDDRVLGKNGTVSLPVRWTWVATGNNAVVSTDIVRRSVRIRLTPMTDKPWLREDFRHPNLREWVSGNRSDLIWAALVLGRSWIADGRPAATTRALGSYESWSSIIGGILEHAGIPGFLGNIEEFYEITDTEGAIWREFVAGWWEEHGNRPVKSGDVFPIAKAIESFDLGKSDNERSQSKALGIALRKHRDRVFGEFRIEYAGVSHRQSVWRLNRVAAKEQAQLATTEKEPF